jgi:hypothetical protein
VVATIDLTLELGSRLQLRDLRTIPSYVEAENDRFG